MLHEQHVQEHVLTEPWPTTDHTSHGTVSQPTNARDAPTEEVRYRCSPVASPLNRAVSGIDPGSRPRSPLGADFARAPADPTGDRQTARQVRLKREYRREQRRKQQTEQKANKQAAYQRFLDHRSVDLMSDFERDHTQLQREGRVATTLLQKHQNSGLPEEYFADEVKLERSSDGRYYKDYAHSKLLESDGKLQEYLKYNRKQATKHDRKHTEEAREMVALLQANLNQLLPNTLQRSSAVVPSTAQCDSTPVRTSTSTPEMPLLTTPERKRRTSLPTKLTTRFSQPDDNV